MTFEHKDGTGVLFKNDYKLSDKHPDYKGKIKVNGTMYDIAAWIKQGQKGSFMSLKVDTPYEAGRPEREHLSNVGHASDPKCPWEKQEDDIPF